MSTDPLLTYLNDHLAGSVAALELLDHLTKTATTSETRTFFSTLHRDIEDDQQVLQDLLRRSGGTESPFRKVGAWVTEKLGEVKLSIDAAAEGPLHQLEALEALALGIQGKLTLWSTLEAVRGQVAGAGEMNLAYLQSRARDQYARVESRRVAAARAAFGDSAGARPVDHPR